MLNRIKKKAKKNNKNCKELKSIAVDINVCLYVLPSVRYYTREMNLLVRHKPPDCQM